MSVLSAVRGLVDSVPQDVDQALKSRCEIAIALATKIDDAVAGTTGADAQALPGLSKELRAAIDDISGVDTKKQVFISGIFDS